MVRIGEGDFRFWDVEGVAVETARTSDGGLACIAHERGQARPFSLDRLLRHGTAIDLATFEWLAANPS